MWVAALALGCLASFIGGIVGGILVGGKALGTDLAAMMGGFYGPLAGASGTVLGLLILKLIG